MDCLSEGTRSASYGWLKHLLTSHVRWVWSYLSEALSKCVNPSHPGHFVWGQRFGLCDSLLAHTTILPVKPSLRPYRVQLSCQRWRRYRGREINTSVHSHVLPTPLTVKLFIAVWLFCAHGDSYMSTLMVPSCLQEVRHSVSSLPHLHTMHTDTYTLPPVQCCRLSPILSSFHFFWWGGADLASVLCDDHNHFDVSFILLSASILISL